MNAPITVILPVRNGARTIASAVRSTLRALPQNGKVLIHDDASSDDTYTVLDGISDPRVIVLRSEQPRGVAGGLNYLLDQVDTPVVARMDADDVVLPWRFSAQLAAVKRGADVVWSTVVALSDVPGRLRPPPPIGISAAAMPLHMLFGNCVAHSTMLARTEVLRRAGGYRPVLAEDYELWLRLCTEDVPAVRLAVPTLIYRFHPGQATAADGYSRRAWSEPALRASYTALSQRVLGLEPRWYDELAGAGGPPEMGGQGLAVLADAVDSRSRDLSAAQRAFLRRKVQAVLRTASAN